jgi:hypothetical protein
MADGMGMKTAIQWLKVVYGAKDEFSPPLLKKMSSLPETGFHKLCKLGISI